MNSSGINFLIKRSFTTSSLLQGKKNFRKFMLFNKRGQWEYKQNLPCSKKIFYDLGVRVPRGTSQTKNIPEMIPEIIVPDLTGFKLKPYVSYKVPDVTQSEFTAEDLFNACYAAKLIEDYKKDELNEDESLGCSPEEAWIKARQTGSDLFYEKLNIDDPIASEYKYPPLKSEDGGEPYHPMKTKIL